MTDLNYVHFLCRDNRQNLESASNDFFFFKNVSACMFVIKRPKRKPKTNNGINEQLNLKQKT